MEDTIETQSETRIWMKRAGWLFLAFILFFITPYALMVLANMTGLTDWSEQFGPLVFFNQENAIPFMLGFGLIIALMAVIMYFVLQAFGSTEGAW